MGWGACINIGHTYLCPQRGSEGPLEVARMRTSHFDYTLPPELIAQTPAEPRDSSRLMVLHRDSDRIEHRRFWDIGDYLGLGDLLVFNDTRVIPARLRGRRPTGGQVELLLLRKLADGSWEALVKPGRVKVGERVNVGHTGSGEGALKA